MMTRSGSRELSCGMQKHSLVEERLTYSVIGAFYEVYSRLGFGFLNRFTPTLWSTSSSCADTTWLVRSASRSYKGHVLGIQRIDRIVDEKLVVETKATQELQKACGRQVQSYLRATALRVGLLLHFGPQPRFYRYLNPLKDVQPKSAQPV